MRFSSAVSCLSRLGDWKTTPICRRIRSRARGRVVPQDFTAPGGAGMSVQRIRKRVVLPLPLGPRKPNTSPGLDAQAQVVECETPRIAAGIGERQVIDFDDGVG